MVESEHPMQILSSIPQGTGMLWEKIKTFQEQINSFDESLTHKAGEIFMPAGHLIISMVHKQNHPSFLLRGKVSYLTDEGLVETITAPHVIKTKEGAQRVLYIHEDTDWCCVYRTDKETFEEAEADVYADTYHDLPNYIIEKKKLLWED